MKKPFLKICGITQHIEAIAALNPEYMGFIFYKKSPRFFKGKIPTIPSNIQKVGVFVDMPIPELIEIVNTHALNVVQLHGSEQPQYLQQLQDSLKATHNSSCPKLWKAFGVDAQFNFSSVKAYTPYVNHFLWDTKTPKKGGSGLMFNWNLLKQYPFQTPCILSGGIGLNSKEALKHILQQPIPIEGLDINSLVEISPGVKDLNAIKAMQQFINTQL